MKTIVLALMALSLNSAFAAGNCKDQFKRNLQEIQRKSRSMKPACWAQVQKGESNSGNIMSICSSSEVDVAYSMDAAQNRNIALCNGSCAGELNAAKLCVDGKSLSYYFSKLK